VCLCGVALVPACGKRGDPLPPLRRAPQPVTDLRVAQRGAFVEVRFTAPRAYTDGERLGVVEIELLRADREGALEQVALVSLRRAAPGEALVETEPLPAPGTTLRFAARAREKKSVSVLATAPALLVQAAPPPPVQVQAAPGARGVGVSWQSAAGSPTTLSFRVYRRAPDGAYDAPLIAAPTLGPPFEDSTLQPGQKACYVVRSVAALDPLVESAPSAESCTEAKDVTPPAAPEGGAAYLQDDGAVELSWSPLLETDLATYRVYRRTGAGARERVAEVPPTETRWRDAQAGGARRVYTLTAVDLAGNESAPSAGIVVERTQ
jgi:hypothetical protein